MRLQVKGSALLLAPLWFVWLGGALSADDSRLETREFRYLMGTSIQVRAVGGNDEARRAAIAEAFASIAEVDRLMSNYRDDSELALVNRDAASRPVMASEALMRVLEAAQRVSRDSQGAFDVTVGPLVRLWGFHDKKARIPSSRELAAVQPLISYQNLILDPARRTIRFARPGVELDLGGIAKGFAVEVAAGVLRRRGLEGFIDAGGNQYLLGLPPGKRSWSVGIKDPDRPGHLLGVLDLQGGSVSTSADDANFLVADGRRYGHLLDPRTLQPSTASLSATVVAADGTLADAMSKAAFLLGPKDGLALVQSYPGMSVVIAYRSPSGRVELTISPALAGRFHPVTR